ncbi:MULTISPECIES: DUF309 domain-containing protein [Alteribacter]|uniref:DUF309 domain-containing protein n=1 Tax=Alteribacter keqinensis TaxID=2483800 RepID=A0A3M7TTW8_9BACI|nr:MULTISPECIES: DUF309 domain-containing protein [Alteribacter]MBM7094726.1 DUF309 domain-containing protein [Alteribacter salitolerans]RNA69078.1 DUF309 domain-containing protein [Alteribacter keqinensis]
MKNYPEAYIEYLVYFQGERDLFECHEVMEEYWKKDRQPQWLALIQLAVAMYHHRQENYPGAKKLLKKVIAMIETDPFRYTKLGIDTPSLLGQLKRREVKIDNKEPYETFNLTLNDQKLEKDCISLCAARGVKWGSTEDLTDKNLIYRHKRRDRTDVIKARKTSLLEKKKERG